MYISVGVMKDYQLKLRDLHVHIHWVARGTGTPEDRDKVKRREVCFVDGRV